MSKRDVRVALAAGLAPESGEGLAIEALRSGEIADAQMHVVDQASEVIFGHCEAPVEAADGQKMGSRRREEQALRRGVGWRKHGVQPCQKSTSHRPFA